MTTSGFSSWRPRVDIAFIMMIALLPGCRPSDRREARDFERMRRQQRYNAYDTSGFFANGAVLQAPPPHTIPRNLTRAARGEVTPVAFATGRANDQPVTDIPVALDDRLRADGARQYGVSCAPCHGVGGFGGGTMAPNLAAKRPPSLRSGRVAALPVGTLFNVITDGFGRMPAYGWQLSPEQRWAVIAYVRSLATMPPTDASRADSAMAMYLQRVDSLHASGVRLETLLQFVQPDR